MCYVWLSQIWSHIATGLEKLLFSVFTHVMYMLIRHASIMLGIIMRGKKNWGIFWNNRMISDTKLQLFLLVESRNYFDASLKQCKHKNVEKDRYTLIEQSPTLIEQSRTLIEG